MEEYINGEDFFNNITNELKKALGLDMIWPYRYIHNIATVEYFPHEKKCNKYKIKKKNINTTIIILQELYEQNQDIKDWEKDLVCNVLDNFKVQ